MINFFKKDNNLYAPISGVCKNIEKCEDKTFSEKLLGNGYFVVPDSDIVCSPCNGIITMLFPTKHALGIKMNNGQEIMVHIGVDTVKLNGENFTAMVAVDDKVKKGTPLIKFDKKYIDRSDLDMSVIIIALNSTNLNFVNERINQMVEVGDKIIDIGLT